MESARALANRTYLETLLATFVSKLINYIVVRSLGCSVRIISSRFSPISVCFGQNKRYIITNNFPALKRSNAQKRKVEGYHFSHDPLLLCKLSISIIANYYFGRVVSSERQNKPILRDEIGIFRYSKTLELGLTSCRVLIG